jgi:hypothetical protein
MNIKKKKKEKVHREVCKNNKKFSAKMNCMLLSIDVRITNRKQKQRKAKNCGQ